MKVENNHFSLTAVPHQSTLADYIAEQLRQAILSGQIKLGQKLIEQEIANALHTSRSPVRDALRQLKGEGLVIGYAHRGTYVIEINCQEVLEIYSLLETLESLAIECAIKFATPEEIDTLDKVAQRIEKLIRCECTKSETIDLYIEFHHTLCKISNHRRLQSIWETFQTQTRLLLLNNSSQDRFSTNGYGEEWPGKVVSCIRRHDLTEALAELHLHMTNSSEAIIESIKNRTDQEK
jgi:DNA-binding GntR family transcriptional regulator